MTRTAWVLLLVLVASNAAWVVTWLADAGGGRIDEADREALEGTIADLREEVAVLRGAGAAARGPGAGRGPETPEEAFGIEGGGPELVPGGRRPDPEAEARQAARLSAEERQAAEEARRQEVKAREEALAYAKAILEKVMQIKDAGLRQEGLRQLEAALVGSDPILTEYALGALHALRDLRMDRSGFRDIVLGLLDSEHPGIRRSALYALHATGAAEGDLRFALAGARDESPVVRQHAARVLRTYTDGRFEGAAGEALVALLCDENLNVRKGTLQGLSGARVTPEAEAKLIEIASRPEERYDAVYHGLSTLGEKSRRVVDALFGYLSDENHRVRARAHWGLQRSVKEEVQPYVARRYAEHLDKFLNPMSHGEALKVIARHGDASLIPQLERFASNELIEERVREWTLKVVEHLRNK